MILHSSETIRQEIEQLIAVTLFLATIIEVLLYSKTNKLDDVNIQNKNN